MTNRRIAIAAICAALCSTLAVTAPQASAARTKTCADHSGQVYSYETTTRVWHDETSLRSCIIIGRGSRSSRRFIRLGAWDERARFVTVYGNTALWVAPVADAQGRPTGFERIWARGLLGGRMVLAGIKAGWTNDGARADGVVSAITSRDGIVAWTSGDSASAVGMLSGYEVHSLPGDDLVRGGDRGKVVLLGTWPGKAMQLALSLTIGPAAGDGDDCGGMDVTPVTVTPDGTPMGVTLWHGYSRPGPPCNG